MFVVVYSREHRTVHSKHFRVPIPFIPLFARRIQRLIELRSGDMKLIRIDPDDGSILFVKVTNVKGVLAIMGVDVVVEFVPKVLVRWRLTENQSITRMLARPVWARGMRR